MKSLTGTFKIRGWLKPKLNMSKNILNLHKKGNYKEELKRKI